MTTATPRKSNKARDPKSVELSPRPDGTLGALSSNGIDIYTLRQVAGAWCCQCPGFAARETCCHSIAAAQARTCEHCGCTGAAVEVFVNRWDNDSTIVLCSDVRACMARQGVK